jgi:hypothetical protein
MISIASAGLSFLLLAGFAAAKAAPSGGDSSQTKKDPAVAAKHESPFACDRLALDSATRKRHFDELGPALRPLRKAVRELPDGYEFQFPSDPKTIAMVAEWAAGERLCCPFFDIQPRMEREHGPFWLRITGREGTKQFIQVDAAAWVKM